MSETAPYTLDDALDMNDAREATRAIAHQRRSAKDRYEDAIDEYEGATANEAEKERDYRKLKATLWLRPEGETAKAKEAWVDSESAEARYARDIATGLTKGAYQRIKLAEEKLNEVDAERASLHRLIEWSMRVDPFAQQGTEVPA